VTAATEAVIFDLDGVLVESEQVWAEAKREVTVKLGGTWTDAAVQDMLGMSSHEWSHYMSEQLGIALAPAAISQQVVADVEARYRANLPVIEGADQAVHRLAAHWQLGLASSSNREVIELVLSLTGWSTQFAVTVSSDEVPRGKPAPDVYLEAARRLGATPALCVAVEDSGAGIRSSKAAGLCTIAIPNRAFPPEPEILSQAEIVLGSISELDVAAVAGARGGAVERREVE
jgi:HAD superfamily hydrolase (TIGR01509 family)